MVQKYQLYASWTSIALLIHGYVLAKITLLNRNNIFEQQLFKIPIILITFLDQKLTHFNHSTLKFELMNIEPREVHVYNILWSNYQDHRGPVKLFLKQLIICVFIAVLLAQYKQFITLLKHEQNSKALNVLKSYHVRLKFKALTCISHSQSEENTSL